jgi:hypothetical protein
MDKKRRAWLADLREAEKRPRVLVHVHEPIVSDRENCVICENRTENWLFPENAPVCDDACLVKYLEDPSVYDPRGLHTLKVISAPKKPRKRLRPTRWEPSESDIADIQQRIRDKRTKKPDE